jgi:hypothetical protein
MKDPRDENQLAIQEIEVIEEAGADSGAGHRNLSIFHRMTSIDQNSVTTDPVDAPVPCYSQGISGAANQQSSTIQAGAWSLAFSSPRTHLSTPPCMSRSHTAGESRK